MEGIVVHGEKRGRLLGYPTANVDTFLSEEITDGVYPGSLQVDGCSYKAAISIGSNPTFNGKRRQVEVHILGVESIDLYGQSVRLTLGKKIREQIRFEKIEDLIDQIREDIRIIKEMI